MAIPRSFIIHEKTINSSMNFNITSFYQTKYINYLLIFLGGKQKEINHPTEEWLRRVKRNEDIA